MAKQRISVTVDDEVLKVGRRAVKRGRAATLSAWVNEALRRQAEHEARLEAGARAVKEWEAEHGKITDEDIAAAQRWLDEGTEWIEPPKRRRKSA